MKNIKLFSISLIITLFAVISMNAQNPVMSGSFQFINDINKRVGVIILQSGTQKFEFPITENIIVANLLPGRYSLVVEFQSGGRVGQMARQYQNIDIESNRRTVCRMNASAMLTFTKEYDRNSVQIFVSNPQSRYSFDRRADNYSGNSHYRTPQPISDVEFNRLYNSVKNESFSNTKMQTLKVSSNYYEYFTSEQVRRLAMLFSADNDKLECVKYLAPKVLDAQNLPFLKDVFSFSSTKDAYLRFLNNI